MFFKNVPHYLQIRPPLEEELSQKFQMNYEMIAYSKVTFNGVEKLFQIKVISREVDNQLNQ